MGRTHRFIVLALIALLIAGCDKIRDLRSGATSASASASAAPPPAPAESVAKSAAPEPKPAPSAAAADAGSEKPAPPKITRRPGIVGEMFTRARSLELKDEQKTVLDRLDQELWGPQTDPELDKAYKEFVTILIDGVKAGRIETQKLTPHYATIEKAAQARREREAAALGELHGVLDSAQRKRLVEMVKQAHPAPPSKTAKAPKPPKPGKAGKLPKTEKQREAERAKQRLDRVAALLGLVPAQRARVDAVLARFDPSKLNQAQKEKTDKRRLALLETFEQEDPDASQLDLGAGPRAMLQHRVQFLTALLGAIKPDQREKLARTIERPRGRHWAGLIVGQPGPVADS